jgi:hypothetical protein
VETTSPVVKEQVIGVVVIVSLGGAGFWKVQRKADSVGARTSILSVV